MVAAGAGIVQAICKAGWGGREPAGAFPNHTIERMTVHHTAALLDTVHARFIPNKVLALLEPGSEDSALLEGRIPLLATKTMVAGKATAYVCENFACQRPVNEAAALDEVLSETR